MPRALALYCNFGRAIERDVSIGRTTRAGYSFQCWLLRLGASKIAHYDLLAFLLRRGTGRGFRSKSLQRSAPSDGKRSRPSVFLTTFNVPEMAELPGCRCGRRRTYRSWGRIKHATMLYSYGLSASLLQLAQLTPVLLTTVTCWLLPCMLATSTSRSPFDDRVLEAGRSRGAHDDATWSARMALLRSQRCAATAW